jgi:CHAD domain-containing protein
MTTGEFSRQIGVRTPLWQAARHLLFRRGDEYAACCAATLASFGLDEIHDLRVASRRLREALFLFAPCYDETLLTTCSREVRKVTRSLGHVRNLDESFLFFAGLAENLDAPHRMALTPFLMSREAARGPHLTDLARFLAEKRPDRFLERHRRYLSCPMVLNSPGGMDLFMPLREFAEGAMKERHDGLLPLVEPARCPADDAARHQLRIALKHYRYRFELFEPLADSRYDRVYRLIKQYQEHLGVLNDLTVFSGMVTGGLVPPPFVPGVTTAIELKKQKLVRSFLKLLERKPIAMIRFPFGG